MSDLNKTLISLPALAVAVVLLLVANHNPQMMRSLFSTDIGSVPPSNTYVAPTKFDLAPFQGQPHFPDR